MDTESEVASSSIQNVAIDVANGSFLNNIGMCTWLIGVALESRMTSLFVNLAF